MSWPRYASTEAGVMNPSESGQRGGRVRSSGRGGGRTWVKEINGHSRPLGTDVEPVTESASR
jgi:hypothetical protein